MSQTHGAEHDGLLRVIVVDDGSTDGTGEIAREFARRDSRVVPIRVDSPPPGWGGKVHAMHVGVEAAGPPEAGEWLLFLDADTVAAPDLLSRLLATAEAIEADLVSTPGGPPPKPPLRPPSALPAKPPLPSPNFERISPRIASRSESSSWPSPFSPQQAARPKSPTTQP